MGLDSRGAFLERYRSELAWLRRMGAEYARAYPRIAKRLELSQEPGQGICPDPHVERLIESFAFLTARVQMNLEAELPEVTTGLLGTLYPHFTQPIPSMAIAQFQPDPRTMAQLEERLRPRHTKLFAHTPNQRRPCRFRTCYDVELWPIEVAEAKFEAAARYRFLNTPTYADVTTVLRLELVSHGDAFEVMCRASGADDDGSASPGMKRVRFHLNGDPTAMGGLYDLLCTQLADIMVLSDGGNDATPVPIGTDAWVPVGFRPDEAVLPCPDDAHDAFRLLQEYFAFPAKFMFFDLEGLDFDRAPLDEIAVGQTMDILILLRGDPGRLRVSPETFALGCTPIVNLFPNLSEPVNVTQLKSEYRVTPGSGRDIPRLREQDRNFAKVNPGGRSERTTEIHTVISVTSDLQDLDATARIEPLYARRHSVDGDGPTVYWHAIRRPAESAEMPGTDLWLSFVDADIHEQLPAQEIVRVHSLCTNRDLAIELDAGDTLSVEEGTGIDIRCLTKPSPQHDPPLGGQSLWRLVSHLSLSHLSLPEGPSATEALREQLRLYQFFTSTPVEHQILGIRQVRREPVVLRGDGRRWRGFVRVQRVTVRVDEDRFVGASPILLGQVLNHYFGLHASINVFTQLVIESQQREGIWKAWPPMIPAVETEI